MYRFTDHPKFYNKPIILIEDDADPLIVINRFFSDFTLSEIRSILWNWFETAITSENDYYNEAEDRATLLYQYRRIEELIEAAFIISNHQSLNPPL